MKEKQVVKPTITVVKSNNQDAYMAVGTCHCN